MITSRHLAIAEQNGISPSLVHSRIKIGWSVKQAIHIPVNSHRLIAEEEYKIADKNGLSRKLVYQRVYQTGWSIEDAITKPVRPAKGQRVYSTEMLALAKKNGIAYETFRNRVKGKGWSEYDAATIPIMKRRYGMAGL